MMSGKTLERNQKYSNAGPSWPGSTRPSRILSRADARALDGVATLSLATKPGHDEVEGMWVAVSNLHAVALPTVMRKIIAHAIEFAATRL